jgi:hypothetical protein
MRRLLAAPLRLTANVLHVATLLLDAAGGVVSGEGAYR